MNSTQYKIIWFCLLFSCSFNYSNSNFEESSEESHDTFTKRLSDSWSEKDTVSIVSILQSLEEGSDSQHQLLRASNDLLAPSDRPSSSFDVASLESVGQSTNSGNLQQPAVVPTSSAASNNLPSAARILFDSLLMPSSEETIILRPLSVRQKDYSALDFLALDLSSRTIVLFRQSDEVDIVRTNLTILCYLSLGGFLEHRPDIVRAIRHYGLFTDPWIEIPGSTVRQYPCPNCHTNFTDVITLLHHKIMNHMLNNS